MKNFNVVVQDGRTGRPDSIEAECVSCPNKCYANIESASADSLNKAQKLLIHMMTQHTEDTGHIMIQIGAVTVPVPLDKNIVRRIL
jgi:hypothetical protein